jgi:hypothetical protein
MLTIRHVEDTRGRYESKLEERKSETPGDSRDVCGTLSMKNEVHMANLTQNIFSEIRRSMIIVGRWFSRSPDVIRVCSLELRCQSCVLVP